MRTIFSLLLLFGPGSSSHAAATDAAAATPPTIVVLALDDGVIVRVDQFRALQKVLRQHNPRARIIPVSVDTSAFDRLGGELARCTDDISRCEALNDLNAAFDTMAADVRRSLEVELADVSSIDQFVLLSSYLTPRPVGPANPAPPTVQTTLVIIGLGQIDANGFPPTMALALNPVRQKMERDGSILFLGGPALGSDRAANAGFAARALDFFRAPQGRMFALAEYAPSAAEAPAPPPLSPRQSLALGGAAAVVTSAGVWWGVVPWLLGAVLPVVVPRATYLMLQIRQTQRELDLLTRQTRLGIHHEGYRFDRRGDGEPLDLGWHEREIFSCESTLSEERLAAIETP